MRSENTRKMKENEWKHKLPSAKRRTEGENLIFTPTEASIFLLEKIHFIFCGRQVNDAYIQSVLKEIMQNTKQKVGKPTTGLMVLRQDCAKAKIP